MGRASLREVLVSGMGYNSGSEAEEQELTTSIRRGFYVCVVGFLILLCLGGPAAFLLSGCAWMQSPQGKMVEKDILRAADLVCVLEHAMFPVAEIESACAIEKTLEPAVLQLLAAHKAASDREHVAACGPVDAGKDAK